LNKVGGSPRPADAISRRLSPQSADWGMAGEHYKEEHYE